MAAEPVIASAQGVAVNLVCTDPDRFRFCRRMSADVDQSPMRLDRVMVMGHQLYPPHDVVLGNPDVVLRCEFWIRDSSVPVREEHVKELLGRLASYMVIDAYTIDRHGAVIDRVPLSESVIS